MQQFVGVVERSLSFVGITLPIEYGPVFALRLLDMGHPRLRLLHICNNMMRLLVTWIYLDKNPRYTQFSKCPWKTIVVGKEDRQPVKGNLDIVVISNYVYRFPFYCNASMHPHS